MGGSVPDSKRIVKHSGGFSLCKGLFMNLQTIINDYHQLLHHSDLAALATQLAAGQHERRMLVGKARDRLVCSVLRPRFIIEAQYATLLEAATQIGRAIRTIGAAALQNAHMLTPYQLTPTETTLLQINPGYAGVSMFGRLDGFLAADGSDCYFVESNLESPAGIAYDEALATLFEQTEIMAAFRKQYRAQPVPVRHDLQLLLLETYAAWGGTGIPTIAIVDFPGVVTWSEFEYLQHCFVAAGIPTILAGPDDLRYQGGKLLANGTPIDLVYRRILQHEFLREYDLNHPLIRAYADHAVCVVNPLCSKPVHTKLIMWLLSDAEGPAAGLVTSEQQAAIDRHVPWSRIVQTGPTRYQGERIDLLPFIRNNRERLVLKPNDDYGGKGVVLGWETTPAAWEQAIESACAIPSLVQERVPVPVEQYPTWSAETGLQITDRYVDSDPCIFGNIAAGCLTRIASTALLNVSAGGGSAPPTFLVSALAE
jgi:hypothetical protein